MIIMIGGTWNVICGRSYGSFVTHETKTMTHFMIGDLCMNVPLYVYEYRYTYLYVYIYIHTYIFIYIYIYTYVHIYIYV
jgi:hypothetical protein